MIETIYFLANVPDDLLPLAFGTKGCSAADVPKVPKAWELGQSARSAFFYSKECIDARAVPQ